MSAVQLKSTSPCFILHPCLHYGTLRTCHAYFIDCIFLNLFVFLKKPSWLPAALALDSLFLHPTGKVIKKNINWAPVLQATGPPGPPGILTPVTNGPYGCMENYGAAYAYNFDLPLTTTHKIRVMRREA